MVLVILTGRAPAGGNLLRAAGGYCARGRSGPGRFAILRHEVSDGGRRVHIGKSPVKQCAGILGVHRNVMHERDDEGVTATPNRSDVCSAGGGGEPVLDADRSRIGTEQLIVVLDLEGCPAEAPDGRSGDGKEATDDGAGQRGPTQQGKIICGGCLTWSVQAAGIPGPRVACLQVRCRPVHQRDRGIGAACGFGERHGGVVAAGDEHGCGQLRGGVGHAGDEPHPSSVNRRCRVADRYLLGG